MKVFWHKVIHWGNEKYDSEDLKHANTITNVGSAFGLLVYAISILGNLIGIYIILNLDYDKYIGYILPYVILTLIFVPLSCLTWYLKNKTKHLYLYSTIFLLLSLTYNSILSIMFGVEFGFHWIVIGLLPLYYISGGFNIRNLLLLDLFSLIIFFGVIHWHSESQALYPLPAFLAGDIANVLKTGAISMAVAGLILIGWKEGLWSYLGKAWSSWCKLGDENFTTLEDKKTNIISNHIYLIFVVMSVLVALANSFLVIWSMMIEGKLLMPYIVIYSGTSFASFVLAIIIFRFKIKSQNPFKYEVAAYLMGIFYVSFIAVCLGVKSNYQFSVIPFFTVPFFLSKDSWRLRVSLSLLVPIAVLLTGVLQTGFGVLYPLPYTVEEALKSIIVIFIVFALSAQFLYLAWKYNYIDKALKLWRDLSDYGNEHFENQTDKRYNILGNQIIAYYTAQTAFLLVMGTGIIYFLLLDLNFSVYVLYFYYFIPVPLTGIILFALIFRFQHKFKNKVLGKYILFIYSIILLSYLAIMLGKENGIQTYFLTLIPIPLLVISKEYPRIIITGELFLVISIAFVHFLLKIIPAPLPLPSFMNQMLTQIININTFVSIIAMAYYFWKESRRSEEILLKEKKKSQELLLNILPASVADTLILDGKFIPVDYKGASVLFTDFVGFTHVAESMSPQELTEELDRCFSYFDSVAEHYNLEKLKTIGDSYMAAGGLPEVNHTHAFDAVMAAMEIQNFMNQMKTIKEAQDLPYWELRLGINSGPLVAGVIGKNKFAYDIWGETVNVASRMESFGQSGKINISAATYEQIKFLFKCKYRGTLKKGSSISSRMYLVEGIKTRYSVSGNGQVPNKRFKEIYDRLKHGAKLISKI